MKLVFESVACILISVLILWLYIVFFDKSGDRCVIKLPTSCLMQPPFSSKLIKCLRKMARSRKKIIYLDIGYVASFNFESYIVILAQAEKIMEKNKNVFLWAKSPLSLMVKRTLMTPAVGSSTYHQHLSGNNASVFIKKSDISVPVLDKVEKDLRRIGIKDYYDLNTLITEIIGNAIEHGIKGKDINWWMYHYVERGKMTLVFVDMGIGILSSYRKAGIGRNLNDKDLIV